MYPREVPDAGQSGAIGRFRGANHASPKFGIASHTSTAKTRIFKIGQEWSCSRNNTLDNESEHKICLQLGHSDILTVPVKQNKISHWHLKFT